MKVLIFFANYGNGHIQVAKTIENILNNGKNIVKVFNAKKMDNKYLTELTEYCYNDILTKNASNKLFKEIFDLSFKLASKSEKISYYGVKKGGHKTMTQLIDVENPDLIITTFPYAIPKNAPRTISIITDYGFSNTWYDKRIDYYFVATEFVKKQVQKKKKKDIFVTGIPIPDSFFNQNTATKIRTVLFNLGARGQFSKKNLKKAIKKSLEKNLVITVICGKNKKLFQELSEEFIEEEKVMIYGYVTNMAQLLKKNDLVITKAGGISVTECIASGKPMIINKSQSLKGQESFNCKYISKEELGLLGEEKEIGHLIQKLTDNQALYMRFANNIKKVKVANQSSHIRRILDNIQNDEVMNVSI